MGYRERVFDHCAMQLSVMEKRGQKVAGVP